MKPSIPQLQGYLYGMADELVASGQRGKAKRLRRYTTQLSRVPSVRHAPAAHPMPTPKQVLAVRLYRSRFPDVSYRVIANKFRVGNDGRVSEIIRGKRGKPVYNRKGVRI